MNYDTFEFLILKKLTVKNFILLTFVSYFLHRKIVYLLKD